MGGAVTLSITTPTPGAGCDIGLGFWSATPVGNAAHQVALVLHAHDLSGHTDGASTNTVSVSVSGHVHGSSTLVALVGQYGSDRTLQRAMWNTRAGGEGTVADARFASVSGVLGNYGDGDNHNDLCHGTAIIGNTDSNGDTVTASHVHTHSAATGVGSSTLAVVAPVYSGLQNIQPRSVRVRFIIRIK